MKNVIDQINSKNKWLVLSGSFTAKFGLDFVLTLENAFSKRFQFIASRKSICSSRKQYRFERSASFYVTISGNFERFQYFNFEADFLENEKIFQKTGVPFFSLKH